MDIPAKSAVQAMGWLGRGFQILVFAVCLSISQGASFPIRAQRSFRKPSVFPHSSHSPNFHPLVSGAEASYSFLFVFPLFRSVSALFLTLPSRPPKRAYILASYLTIFFLVACTLYQQACPLLHFPIIHIFQPSGSDPSFISATHALLPTFACLVIVHLCFLFPKNLSPSSGSCPEESPSFSLFLYPSLTLPSSVLLS